MDKLERSTCMHVLICWQGGGVRINLAQVTFTNCNIYENTATGVRAPPNLSIAPMDKITGMLFLQGGGVMIYGDEVTFISCNTYGNTAYYVRVPPNLSVAPMDKC